MKWIKILIRTNRKLSIINRINMNMERSKYKATSFYRLNRLIINLNKTAPILSLIAQ